MSAKADAGGARNRQVDHPAERSVREVSVDPPAIPDRAPDAALAVHGEAIRSALASRALRELSGNEITEGMLNSVEVAIRAYDPCLSCATHALGQMPLKVEVVAPDGAVLDQKYRD